MSVAGSRVLVTGATGFLGGYVVHDLRSHGAEVFAAGRDRVVLEQIADRSHRVLGDLASLAETDLSVDAVIHCAALSSPWGAWRAFEEANVSGTAHVAEFARRNGVRRIVNVSSPSLYAAPRDQWSVREDHPLPSSPMNGYIRSKIAAEALLTDALRRGRLPELVTMRPRGLIGVGDRSLVPRLIAMNRRLGVPIFDGGVTVIDVTAVENVAVALRLALTEGDGDGGVYNIANDEPREFGDLLSTLFGMLGEPLRERRMNRRVAWAAAGAIESAFTVVPGRPEPPFTRYTLSTIAFSLTLDITRAKRELGYLPVVPIDESLERIARDLRDRP